MSKHDMGRSKLVNFDDRNVVAKSNQLVQGQLTIRSINLNRIIYSVLSCINPNVPELAGATDREIEDYYRYQDPDACFFRIELRKFIDYWKLHNNVYQDIRDLCESLMEARMSIAYHQDDKLTTRFVNAVEFAEYNKDDGVYIRITPSVMPYLVNLHQRVMGYTNMPLNYLVGMNSLFSWKLLELLLQRAEIGYLELDMVTLREIFDCRDKYPKFYHFRVNVLDMAIKEIGEIKGESPKISYEAIKKGRSIDRVKFTFSFPRYVEMKRKNKARSQYLSKEGDVIDIDTTPAIATQVTPPGRMSKRALEMVEEAKRLREQG